MELTMQSVRKEIETLNGRIERLQAKLSDAKRRRDALMLTLEHFAPTPPKPKRRPPELDVNPDQVRGMALEQALLFIAERTNGLIQSSAVRPVLCEAGILRGKTETQSHALCRELAENPRFMRMSPGRYRLVDDAEEAELDAVAAERHEERMQRWNGAERPHA